MQLSVSESASHLQSHSESVVVEIAVVNSAAALAGGFSFSFVCAHVMVGADVDVAFGVLDDDRAVTDDSTVSEPAFERNPRKRQRGAGQHVIRKFDEFLDDLFEGLARCCVRFTDLIGEKTGDFVTGELRYFAATVSIEHTDQGALLVGTDEQTIFLVRALPFS